MEKGNLIGGLTWGHITVTVPLGELDSDIESTCQLIDLLGAMSNAIGASNHSQAMKTRNHYTMFQKKLIPQCENLRETRAYIMATLERNDIPLIWRGPREKRFVATLALAAGAIVGGFIGSMFSSFKTAHLVDILNKRTNAIAHQVETNTLSVIRNTANIEQLTRTIHTCRKALERVDVALEQDHYFQNFLLITSEFEQQEKRMNAMARAIDIMLQGNLDRDLIPAKYLWQSISEIKKQAEVHNLKLGAVTQFEMYQLPASHLYHLNSSALTVFLHVPLYRPANSFPLFKYINTPIYIPQSDSFLSLETENKFIGRNLEQTLFMELPSIENCVIIGQNAFCEDAILRKMNYPSCLASLLAGITPKTTGLCDTHVSLHPTPILRIDKLAYLVSSNKPSRVMETCSRSPNVTILPPGSYIIQTQSKCGLTSEVWNIPAFADINANIAQSVVIPHQINITTLLANISIPEIEKLLQQSNDVRKTIPLSYYHDLNILRKTVADSNAEFNAWDTWSPWKFVLASAGLSSVFSTIMTLIIIRCCRPQQPVPQLVPERVPGAQFNGFFAHFDRVYNSMIRRRAEQQPPAVRPPEEIALRPVQHSGE